MTSGGASGLLADYTAVVQCSYPFYTVCCRFSRPGLHCDLRSKPFHTLCDSHGYRSTPCAIRTVNALHTVAHARSKLHTLCVRMLEVPCAFVPHLVRSFWRFLVLLFDTLCARSGGSKCSWNGFYPFLFRFPCSVVPHPVIVLECARITVLDLA